MGSHITITDLERITGQQRHVLNHAIRLHGPAPADRIGIIRLWRSEDVPRVFESLRKTTRISRSIGRGYYLRRDPRSTTTGRNDRAPGT